MEDNSNVLVTYSWNRVGYNVLRSLSKRQIKVIVGDAHKLAMSRYSKYKHAFFQYPSFYQNPRDFIDVLIKVAEEYSASVYLPVHEETFIASKYKDKLKSAGITTPVSDFDVLERLHKKERLFETCTELGIPTPQIRKVSDVAYLEHIFEKVIFPVVVKFDQTNSAKGVHYIHTREDAVSQYLSMIKKEGKYPFLQEYVEGVGYGVSLLMNKGEVRAVFTHKRLREKTYTGGTSTVRVSVKNPILEEYAVALLSKLKFHGVAMVEFKYNEKTNKAFIIDVNPRFWGSLALAIHAGVDFPYLLFKMARDGDVIPVLDYREGVTVKWVLGDVLALLSEVVHTKKIFTSIKNFLSQKVDGYDDLYKDDLLPFLFESIYYFSKFLATRSVNPSQEAMLDIDSI